MYEDSDTVEVEAPVAPARLTNQQILLGKRVEPLDVITTYSDSEWEMFVREWVESLRAAYKKVRRASGSGDKGRDVIGYVDQVSKTSPYDNYQCKHYDHALYPSDLWKELAKLCFYTRRGDYSIPRSYFFVAPRGLGPDASALIESPEKIRAGLLERWAKGKLLSVGGADIKMSSELKAYVTTFSFDIVKDVAPSEIIEAHRKTRFYAPRFGGGLVRLPPAVAQVPNQITSAESNYVAQLLRVYSQRAAVTMPSPEALEPHPQLKRHFDRQRNYFYLAELLRNFTRDNIPEDTCFERLQDLIFDGVIDTVERDHSDGYERLNQTLAVARSLQIDSHPLKECLEPYHRSGICHQLANEQRLDWMQH
jgi:hypothetical protein